MSTEQIRLLAFIVGITLISGIGDSQGFIHAAKMWQNGKVVWDELRKSASGFGVGIGTYWISVKYFKEFGVLSPEIQTLIWFGVTIIGVALIGRKFFVWERIDQVVAVFVFLGISWLLVRIVE
jgi:hypothetical protein